ncbi:putative aminoacyltransferase, E1 ubiquitin-activating enzyme [Rosa chinensis]|uniref:Putative aminoacyltransferase, E1 ubiquitin-activating enzyme n=2 Tax=Rosa chinensis TaxID=74649 RepID=A0A2P6PZY5_ROSCH|nr:putative aminoacyltransferase, E1 ubiquitin-activating enzyme [Rosa chinensis]
MFYPDVLYSLEVKAGTYILGFLSTLPHMATNLQVAPFSSAPSLSLSLSLSLSQSSSLSVSLTLSKINAIDSTTMRTQQPKLKTQFFSCGFFGHCTGTVLSPTTPHPPTLPLSSTDPFPPSLSIPAPSTQSDPLTHHQSKPDSESSSSSTSQSFTQWKFPLPESPILSHTQPGSDQDFDAVAIFQSSPAPPPPPQPMSSTGLQELFHAAELQLSVGSFPEQLAALQLLERSLVPYPPSDPECPPELMRGLVRNLKNKAGAKPATKVLLALCLAEANRHVAVEAGAASAVIETALELEDTAAERALAALELMCTVAEGAAEVKSHALAVPVMVMMMGRTSARGKEYAIGVLAVIYGGASEDETAEAVSAAPAEEVARAVELALKGDCSGRGRRKGAQLLKALQPEEEKET